MQPSGHFISPHLALEQLEFEIPVVDEYNLASFLGESLLLKLIIVMQLALVKLLQKILNKSFIQLDDHNKVLLCKGLRFALTPKWSKPVENAEWLNAW